jgi:hypothetical protein
MPYHGLFIAITFYPSIMKITTTISLDEEILAEAKAFAQSHRRSLSNLIEVWIAEKLASLAATEVQL